MQNSIKYIAISVLCAAGLAIPVLAQDSEIEPVDFGAPEALTIEAESGQHNFSVEIADTDEEQARGLMYRDVLAPENGMLFEFAAPKVATIWMKNTGIPLDILFVRANGKILKIEHSATPYSLRSASSEGVVAAVVELAGGRTLELGIMPGDVVKHEFFSNVDGAE